VPPAFEIREPSTEAEFELYRDLRWRILRDPLGRPRTTDADEPSAIHLAAWLDGQAVGAGRAYFNSSGEAQIRGMAVDESRSRQGVGRAIIAELERRVKQRGATQMVLNARHTAIEFYEKCGYRVLGELPSEYPSIRYFRMMKDL
jgi:ribosomal protein S18 acetylase RimI-like enzyme